MLTKLSVRNFKRFEAADIDLGKSVVLIGPNNSGKTSALQALALWDIGLRQWNAKRVGKASPKQRPGVTINRRDLVAIPVPAANLLWRGLHVRGVKRNGGRQNIRVDVAVEGISSSTPWSCGLEFDYSNEESFVCRPLRLKGHEDKQVGKADFSDIPEEAGRVKVAYLPPMSGLADREFTKQEGEINFLIGQGQTAQVLRNLCHNIYQAGDAEPWNKIVKYITSLFGVELLPPKYVAERSEIVMEYDEQGTRLDLSSAGRGLQQTLLLLAHLYAHPGTVLLLDEPDAHLEILRQRQIYGLLTEIAEQQNSQIIAASHSEVMLNEAAGKGKVVAFVGKPHTINDRGSQLLKALTEIGWDQYYQAEENGWVLYLESPADLEILRAFARIFEHEDAINVLARPFVHYVATNLPQKCRDHFRGLREAKPDLVGVALFDRLDKELQQNDALHEMMWRRREIENYFCSEDVLLAYARHDQPDDLFGQAEASRRIKAMRDAIDEVVKALETLGKPDMKPWSPDIKASDDFLDVVFRKYFDTLKLPLLMRKTDYHTLARGVPKDKLDSEVREKLDRICAVARKAVKPKE